MKKILPWSLMMLLLFSQMQGQIIPILQSHAPGVVGLLMPNPKMHVFKTSNFDSTYSLVGIPADTLMELNKFSFLVNSSADMQAVKKEWFVRDVSKSELGQHLFKIYAIKDKAIKQEWYVFPLDSAIYAFGDYYKFDTSMLTKLAAAHPLAYSVKIDSFSNYQDFVSFQTISKENDLFLFLIEPKIGYEGSFEVKIGKENGTNSQEEAVNDLRQYCSKIAGKSKYSIYTRNDISKSEDAGGFGFIIKADHEFYNRYNSKNFIKDKWNKELLIVQSYWIKK